MSRPNLLAADPCKAGSLRGRCVLPSQCLSTRLFASGTLRPPLRRQWADLGKPFPQLIRQFQLCVHVDQVGLEFRDVGPAVAMPGDGVGGGLGDHQPQGVGVHRLEGQHRFLGLVADDGIRPLLVDRSCRTKSVRLHITVFQREIDEHVRSFRQMVDDRAVHGNRPGKANLPDRRRVGRHLDIGKPDSAVGVPRRHSEDFAHMLCDGYRVAGFIVHESQLRGFGIRCLSCGWRGSRGQVGAFERKRHRFHTNAARARPTSSAWTTASPPC